MKENKALFDSAVALAGYLDVNRGVGHTKAMLNGILSIPDALVIVNHMENVPELPKGRKIPLEGCEYYLRGMHKPLAIDNFALRTLLLGLIEGTLFLQDSLAVKQDEARWQETRVELLKETMGGLRKKLAACRKRICQAKKANNQRKK